ncbi:MAG: DUF58 domain-containing protein [Gemmatimonadetes bacterium]|nr:DUF58 domain-containing protein [Gemmatimonadota bacterium]
MSSGMVEISNTTSRGIASRHDLMDPYTLSLLGGIEWVAERVVEGFIMGLHRSPHRGFSAEFAELRPYQHGDDIRHVDWRMFARSDRYYVKQFEEETNLRAHILLDISNSMSWSSEPHKIPTKIWYAQQLAACISLLLLRQGDSVGLTVFHESVVNRIEPKGGQRYWRQFLKHLASSAPQGKTSIDSALKDVASRLVRKGLVILISDLLVDPEGTQKILRFLKHQGHEVLVFHLVDPGERELPTTGDTLLVDPETKEELNVNIADIRVAYREAVGQALDEWYKNLAPFGIDYVTIGTESSLSKSLRFYLHKRSRLG